MVKPLNFAVYTTALALTFGATAASAQNAFNGYQGNYTNAGSVQAATTGIPARNSNHNGAGHAVTNYPYIEGTSYVSPYVNNTGEWNGGKNPDSQCYHGNYGYNGQTSNYDHSSCVVVYDAQTYVRLLRGSSTRGGTMYFGQ